MKSISAGRLKLSHKNLYVKEVRCLKNFNKGVLIDGVIYVAPAIFDSLEDPDTKDVVDKYLEILIDNKSHPKDWAELVVFLNKIKRAEKRHERKLKQSKL